MLVIVGRDNDIGTSPWKPDTGTGANTRGHHYRKPHIYMSKAWQALRSGLGKGGKDLRMRRGAGCIEGPETQGQAWNVSEQGGGRITRRTESKTISGVRTVRVSSSSFSFFFSVT